MTHHRFAAERCLFVGLLLSCFLAGQHNGRNVLWIVADDFGTDAIGCWGGATAPPTPELDNLAQTGMRFTRTFVNPACTPTRAALLAGRYAFREGGSVSLPPGGLGINADTVMLCRAWADVGYTSALIGKWHLGNRFGALTPNHYGWHHFDGVLDGGVPDPFSWPRVTNGVATTCNQYVLTHNVDAALQWIQTQSTPWAMALMLTMAHDPYHAPPAALHTQNLAGLDPTTNPVPFFRAMVEAMDTEVGRLLSSLGPLVLANTNVVVIGDNGTDGRVVQPPIAPTRSKGSLYEAGANVPMIIAGPAVATPGSVSPHLISGVDLFPTLLDLCGISYPTWSLVGTALPLDGISFGHVLAGQAGAARTHVFVEMANSPLGHGYAVRTDTHCLLRYIYNQPQHQEMYDLVADPLQQNDLLTAPLGPGAAATYDQLLAMLFAIRSEGWSEVYGNGCPGSVGVPDLRSQTRPTIGESFYAYLSNLPTGCFWLLGLIGFSRTQAGATALPFPLDGYGMLGCNLLVSIDLSLPFGLPHGYSSPVAVPLNPALVHGEFFLQGLIGDPGANPASVVWSRGLRCVVGQ